MDSLEPQEGKACLDIFGNVILLGLQNPWLSSWGEAGGQLREGLLSQESHSGEWEGSGGGGTSCHLLPLPSALCLTSLLLGPSKVSRGKKKTEDADLSHGGGHFPQILYNKNIQLWASLRFRNQF